MVLREFYHSVCSIVCRELDLSVQELLYSRKERCSDGRCIFVSVLGEYMTDDEIAELSGLSRSCANKIRNGFEDRKRRKFHIRYSYGRILQEVRKLAEMSWGGVKL